MRMNTGTLERGDAYTLVRAVYDKSPGRSWRRLNSALHDALTAAITAHLSFLPEDFASMCHDMEGGYWMGNSEGSVTGERYYSHAVKVGHTPACISFERYAGRPAALWPESVKTPERLCVGKRLTWKGALLDVTSMRTEHLIACSYDNMDLGLSPGCWVYADGQRVIERVARLETGLVLHLGDKQEGYRENRLPKKIVKIPYTELADERKRADVLRKSALESIAGAKTPEELTEVRERLGAERRTYRHFDIEDIRKAWNEREAQFRQAIEKARHESERKRLQAELDMDAAERMRRWLAGEDIAPYFADVRLRVKGRYVETSTGHSVSIEGVKRLIPLAPQYRHKTEDVSGVVLDVHDVREVSEHGVQIGCTLIPWSEIDTLGDAIR